LAKLAVIGAGNMGGAIVRGAIRSEVVDAADGLVIDLSSDVRDGFKAAGCAVSGDLDDARGHEQLLLAIKPQQFPTVAEAIGELKTSTIVISVMAGLSSASIRARLGEPARVIRVMPNTPCQIGTGMSGIALGEGAEPGDERLADELFSAIGDVAHVQEAQMHAVTAISGSGPAYLFLLAESMEQAAEQMGLHGSDARLMVAQTLFGAAKLLRETDHRAVELRQAVTSPGGTTAAALEVMFEKELPEIVIEALQAARDRGFELDAYHTKSPSGRRNTSKPIRGEYRRLHDVGFLATQPRSTQYIRDRGDRPPAEGVCRWLREEWHFLGAAPAQCAS